MPTEKQLAEEFKVSRATIPAALNASTPNHYIVRQQLFCFNRPE
jgi:DNA-binding GntR family transcriptional regulator